MAGISFVEVVKAGPRYTTVLADDGNTYTLRGDRNWRNNNPGNLEYGDFAKSMGAIGTDGRFAVFPTMEQGLAAQENLQFEGKSYRDKSIIEAISRYAPEFENDTAAYAAQVAAAAGVPIHTKMSDLTPSQRSAFLSAQHRVEGLKPGTIMGENGKPVPDAVSKQFSAVRLPPENVGGNSSVSGYQDQLSKHGFDPGPIDGIKGPRTTEAIKAFQRANGLDDDGIVGPLTRAALDKAAGSYALAPPDGLNPTLPPRASYWQEAGGWPSTLNTTTEAETRGEQRTLGARGQGPSLGAAPIPRDRPLMPGPVAPTPRSLPLAPGPAAPTPRQRPGVPTAAPSGGGFLGGLGDALGGGLNFLGSKAQEAGTALGNTANRVVTGTGQALNDSAAAAKDMLADKLLGTVAGRTLLFNTLTGTTPAMKPEERAQQRAASAPEGYGFGPNGKTLYKIGQTYNSTRGPVVFNGTGFSPAQTAVKTQVSVQPSTAMQTRQAQQEDWARRGLDNFGMLSST